VTSYPGMIRGNMIRDEIEYQFHSSLGKLLPCARQTPGASKMWIDYVLAHAIGRANVVVRAKVGECTPESLHQLVVSIGDCDTCGAAFPDAHEPHGIEANVPYGIPLRSRN